MQKQNKLFKNGEVTNLLIWKSQQFLENLIC